MKPATSELTEKPLNTLLSAHVNCSDPNASLGTFSDSDGRLLLTFSAPGGHGQGTVTTLPCDVRLISQASENISAVLLEHSPCSGGVFVLLLGRGTRRRWDVCSTWQAPGPSFISSSDVEIIVELNDITDPCNFSISAIGVVNPPEGQLELWYLSATEGQFLFDLAWSSDRSHNRLMHSPPPPPPPPPFLSEWYFLWVLVSNEQEMTRFLSKRNC